MNPVLKQLRFFRSLEWIIAQIWPTVLPRRAKTLHGGVAGAGPGRGRNSSRHRSVPAFGVVCGEMPSFDVDLQGRFHGARQRAPHRARRSPSGTISAAPTSRIERTPERSSMLGDLRRDARRLSASRSCASACRSAASRSAAWTWGFRSRAGEPSVRVAHRDLTGH